MHIYIYIMNQAKHDGWFVTTKQLNETTWLDIHLLLCDSSIENRLNYSNKSKQTISKWTYIFGEEIKLNRKVLWRTIQYNTTKNIKWNKIGGGGGGGEKK